MANTKTKAAKPENTTPVVEEQETESVSKPAEEPKSAKFPKEKRKFSPDERIECRSVTAGELILVGDKTKLQYLWSNYGDTAYVEYQDLQSLQSRRSGFLTKPLFIIEDEELVQQWSSMLKSIYDKVNGQDVDTIFLLPPDAFKQKLEKLPIGLQETIKTTAAQMIQSDELYDIRKVKIIDEVLGTDLVELFMK